VIMVFIAMIILIILLIICAGMRLSADTAANGETPEQDSCVSIRCALSVGRTENSLRQPWSITSFRIAAILSFSGMKTTGSPFAETATVKRLVWDCKTRIRRIS